MRTVAIRVMSQADLDEVLKIAAGDLNAPNWPRSAYTTALEPEAKPRRIALVAEAPTTSQIAAFCVARVISTEAELETIVTEAGSRRRGVGRMLFANLTAQVEQAGATEIFLEVRESNHAAREFYEALGFSEAGRRTAYYTDPAEDAVLMRLALGARRGKDMPGGTYPQM